MRTQTTFKIAESKDLLGLVDCIQDTFPAPNGEIMANVLDLRKEDYLGYTHLVCEKAIADGMTFIAKNQEGQVIAFCIAESLATAPKYSLEKVSRKFLPLLDLLEELDARYLTETAFPKEKIFHLYMLGVRSNYGGSGLGRELTTGALHFARENGYSAAIAEATGDYSQSICRRLGFSVKASISYKEFLYKGQRPFAGVASPQSCVLVEKVLVS